MPVRSYFSQIFATSPISGIEQHMSKVRACAEELIPFFEAVCAGNYEKARGLYDRIDDLEHEADDIKRKLRLNLPQSLFMPVARADLLDLITSQDRVANRAKDIAGLIVGRSLPIPGPTQELFQSFVSRAVDAAGQADKTVAELSELFESGFRGKEVDVMEDMIATLDEIESDTDRIEIEIREKLYSVEADFPPVDVMFLYKTIDGIGEIANLSQTVGSRLQLILAR